jgi:hypothetical protein
MKTSFELTNLQISEDTKVENIKVNVEVTPEYLKQNGVLIINLIKELKPIINEVLNKTK